MADNVKVAVRIRSIISFLFTNLKEICEYQNGYLFLYLFNNGKLANHAILKANEHKVIAKGLSG